MTDYDNLGDLVKLHARIAKELDRKFELVSGKADPKVILKAFSDQAANAQTSLDKAIRERDAAARHWDALVAKLTASVAERTDALENVREQMQASRKPAAARKQAQPDAARKTAKPPTSK